MSWRVEKESLSDLVFASDRDSTGQFIMTVSS